MYVIACGNRNTAEAAKEVMDKGGNAFDGIVAACFASAVAEPMLTSLAGGGIGLFRYSSGAVKSVDFLTNFPAAESHAEPVKEVVNFGGETQIFYLGYGSLGVPGSLPGLLRIYRRYCTMDLGPLLRPAIRLAEGHRLDRLQAFTLQILKTFAVHTTEAREVFAPRGVMLGEGEIIRNLKLAFFLRMLAKDEEDAMGFFREAVYDTVRGKMSTLSAEDLDMYRVNEPDPVSLPYQGYGLDLAPPPSAGGLLVAHGLRFLEEHGLDGMEHNSFDHVRLLADAMKECDSMRTKGFFDGLLHEEGFWRKSLDPMGNTTHISIVDYEGNAASVTTSNGQGAGIMVKGTGIMLNNFAAEPDLMQYRDLYRPGQRITSMMCPTMITKDGEFFATLGTGGSNRIRSAVLQTVSNMVDFGMSPQMATEASRVHFEDGLLQVEAGIDAERLNQAYKTNIWTEKNLFFGGVHIAGRDAGGGDPRRGGAVITG